MLMRQVKLAAIRRLAKTWNVDDIVDGLNHVVSPVLSESGQRTVIYLVESK
jgi:hypothetical protein